MRTMRRSTAAWEKLISEIKLIHQADELRQQEARRGETGLVAEARRAIIAQNSITVTRVGLYRHVEGFVVSAYAETALGALRDVSVRLEDLCERHTGSKHELAGHLRSIARRLDAMAKKARQSRRKGGKSVLLGSTDKIRRRRKA